MATVCVFVFLYYSEKAFYQDAKKKKPLLIVRAVRKSPHCHG